MIKSADGILLVDKPTGCSSFDVVRKVRKAWGIKKVGHAGTLDPLASGLMIILLGHYTKASDLLLTEDKSYETRIVLGSATNTDDRMGEIVAQSDLSQITRAQLERALASFMGEQLQIPPTFSAIKIGGERCYKKARRGEVIEMKARSVLFHELKILAFDFPNVDVFVKCSKGTYIRSLARDLGNALGGCAHIGELRRVQSGSFNVKDAITMTDMEKNDRESFLRTGPAIFPHLPNIQLSGAQLEHVRCGRRIEDVEGKRWAADEPIILCVDDSIVGTGFFREGAVYPDRVWLNGSVSKTSSDTQD